MLITIDTTKPLSDTELHIIYQLLPNDAQPPLELSSQAEKRRFAEQLGGETHDLTSKPIGDETSVAEYASTGTVKPKRKARKKAETTPEDEAGMQAALDALPAPEQETSEYSLEDAVALATKLIAAGKRAEVKTALDVAGVARVSELDGQIAKLDAFMGAALQHSEDDNA